MASSKLRRCAHCKEREPVEDGIVTPILFFCSHGHAIAYARAKQDKVREQQRRKANAGKVKQRKAGRAQHRADKERGKPKSKWLSELQALVNRYARIRDSADGCMSCDKPASWNGQWHASHYYSRGHSSSLRFNLWNIHKACSICNNHLSGNIEQYTPRIIEKIGRERYDWLASHRSDIRSYDVEWIRRAIRVRRERG